MCTTQSLRCPCSGGGYHNLPMVVFTAALLWPLLSRVDAEGPQEGPPPSPSTSDLLQAWHEAGARITSFVADVEIESYGTCAHLGFDGSWLAMPFEADAVKQIVELRTQDWLGPHAERFHWEMQGGRYRLDMSQDQVIRSAGKEGVKCRVDTTIVSDDINSEELVEIHGVDGIVRKGRVFQGKPRHGFCPFELCFPERRILPTLWSVEDEYYRFESGGPSEGVDGHTTYRLSLRNKVLNDQVHWAVWLDPGAGWMPRRIERYFIKDTADCRAGGNCELAFMRRYEHIELVEPASGVWFPVSAEESTLVPQVGDPSELVMVSKRYITIDPATLQVNQPPPPDRLKLDWPAGTVVSDEIAGTAYHIGENAEKLIEVELKRVVEQAKADPKMELFQASAGAVEPAHGIGTEDQTTGSTSDPPPGRSRGSRPWWLGVGIGCALGLISTLALIHKRHRGN